MSVKDREEILKIFDNMFQGADESGILPTGAAYAALEKLIENARAGAIGWAYADVCVDLDAGKDPRQTIMPGVLERALKDLS